MAVSGPGPARDRRFTRDGSLRGGALYGHGPVFRRASQGLRPGSCGGLVCRRAGLLAEPSAAVVIVSKSGKSPKSLEAAEASRRAGNRVIAITSDGASPLAAAASDVMLTPIGDERGAATKSETAALVALLALTGLIPTDPNAVDRILALLCDVVADESSVAAAGSAAGAARQNLDRRVRSQSRRSGRARAAAARKGPDSCNRGIAQRISAWVRGGQRGRRLVGRHRGPRREAAARDVFRSDGDRGATGRLDDRLDCRAGPRRLERAIARIDGGGACARSCRPGAATGARRGARGRHVYRRI